MVKREPHTRTLAIGDGANDVAMIQEAGVGIGVRGLEGTQASQVSDYSIAKFKYLKRLLCVHGHYNMIRMALLIKYSLYKNMTFVMPLLCFLFFSFFSEQFAYEDWFATLFNTIVTAFPILYLAVLEKDVPDYVLEENSNIYKLFSDGQPLSVKTLLSWLCLAVIHGLSLVDREDKEKEYIHLTIITIYFI